MRINHPAVLMIALLAAAPVGAQHHGEHEAPPQHVDERHGLNHPYNDRGAHVPDLPREALAVPRGNDRYWFHGGQWYRHDGPGFVVVAPPVGLIVPVLPSLYVTLNIGGVPYYYANDTYYTYNADAAGYEVVAPPPNADSVTPPPPTEAGTISAFGGDPQYVYPKNGQSAEQQATDCYECHRWAADQTGFDPTLTSGGVAPDQADAARAQYVRALSACLEGRGYTVR